MEKELKQKLSFFNQIVHWFQEGKLTEDEFQKMMANERRAQGIENEWHDADLMQDEQEEVSLKEVMETEIVSEDELTDMFGEGGREEVMEAEYYAERAERDAENSKYQ